jgi:hypothetical protein
VSEIMANRRAGRLRASVNGRPSHGIAHDLVGNIEPGKTSAKAPTQVNKGTICGPVGNLCRRWVSCLPVLALANEPGGVCGTVGSAAECHTHSVDVGLRPS